MKVVLFCGGQGMRLRGFSENIPKPMVKIGYHPIIWHVMKYYAHFGHKDFILCLGYRADVIKDYFLNYNEYISNDFVLSKGGNHIELLNSEIDDWRISFIDTGLMASIGERLMAVKKHLEGEGVFLANYTDGVTDMYLPEMIDHFKERDKVGCFIGVQPNVSFHTVDIADDGTVKDIRSAKQDGLRINGGFFIFKNEIFDYIEPGDELVEAPFRRLIRAGQLASFVYNGFWACMDTFKEKQLLEDMYLKGDAPWEIWRKGEIQSHASRDELVTGTDNGRK